MHPGAEIGRGRNGVATEPGWLNRARMAHIPLFKIGALVLTTLSKPASKWLEKQAKSGTAPTLRSTCVFLGTRLHRVRVGTTMRLGGFRRFKIKPPNEQAALDEGASFIAGLAVFGVAGGVYTVEHWRTKAKDQAKEEAAREEAAEAARREAERFQMLDAMLAEIDAGMEDLGDRLQQAVAQAARRRQNAQARRQRQGDQRALQRQRREEQQQQGQDHTPENTQGWWAWLFGGSRG